jgi:hypothetical protein
LLGSLPLFLLFRYLRWLTLWYSLDFRFFNEALLHFFYLLYYDRWFWLNKFLYLFSLNLSPRSFLRWSRRLFDVIKIIHSSVIIFINNRRQYRLIRCVSVVIVAMIAYVCNIHFYFLFLFRYF